MYGGMGIDLCILQHCIKESGQLRTLVNLPNGMQWKGGWVDPRAGLDDGENRKI
jgi:hypothetical protein